MTLFSDIDGALRKSLPNITLAAGALGGGADLAALFTQYFLRGGASVAVTSVTNYVADAQQQTISFQGQGEKGPFGGMWLDRVQISVVDGAARIKIDANAPPDWTLSQGFPDLSSPVIASLPFTAAKLRWASHDDEAIGAGFSFSGEIDFSAPPLDVLSFLLPKASPKIWGRIDMQGTVRGDVAQFVPEMSLTIDDTGDDVALGPFKLDGPRLDIVAEPNFNKFDNAWRTSSFVRIATAICLTPDAELPDWIALKAEIADAGASFLLRAEIDEPIASGLERLGKFVGFEKLGVPSFPIHNPDDLLLKRIDVLITPKAASKIASVSLEIGMSDDEVWTLWNDKATLSNIDLLFRFIPGGSELDGTIRGRIGDWLDLRAEFASDGKFAFYGGIAQPTPLATICEFFSDQPLADLPDLTVETLEFELDIDKAQPSQATFSGNLEIAGAWQIVSAPRVMLEGLAFRLARDASANTSIEAMGALELDDYSLVIDGGCSTDLGWSLNGDLALTKEGQSLSDIIARIDKQLGIATAAAASVPDFLTAWSVDSLHVDFATKKLNFDFAIAIGNAALPGLQMTFAVHLLHADDAYSRSFDATAHYVAASVDVTFSFEFKEVNVTNPKPSRTITATGTYDAKRDLKPKLSDILPALAQALHIDESLPKELDFDAEADGFAIKIQQIDKAPIEIEAAGAFSLQVEGQSLSFYFAFTNVCSFDAAFSAPALVGGERARVFGVAVGGLLDLSKLPVVGKIPGVDRLRIDKLGFYYTNAEFAEGAQRLYFEVPTLGDAGALAAATPASLTSKGFNLLAVLGSSPGGGAPLAAIGAAPNKVTTGSAPGFAAGPAAPVSPVKWLDVNKTFGPVTLQKVGVNYSAGEASIGFSAGLTMGGFSLSLEGLTITFPMPLPGKSAGETVSFDLQGLMFDVKRDAFTMGGAFLEVLEGGVRNYYGEVIVHAANFGLTAIGGYTPGGQGTPAAFFIYVKLDAPLGGPPFLFVTGVAGGFGVNRGLVLPTLDTLATYPLLPNNAPPQSGSAGDALKTALTALSTICPDKPGAYWVAAGIKFTSFEMIEAFALLTISFGVDLQIGLLGECSMTFPKGEPEPIAYAEIDIVASVTPSTGLLAVYGVVSPASFVYGGFCHLFGGFAFNVWFSGEHRGDFVVSLGGYHPAYVKPAHYPAPSRLGLSFALGPLQVEGRAYFALTPAMMMAGLAVTASWNSGEITAWLAFDADFLIAWAPFHYEAVVQINLGCKVNLGLLTLDIHLGADLKVWGPEFGGTVHVDLDVIAFTIAFGAEAVAPAPLDWTAFKAKFLPRDTPPPKRTSPRAGGQDPVGNIVKANVAAGLLATDVAGWDWVLDPDNWIIVTTCAIPSNAAVWRLNDDYTIPSALSSYHKSVSSDRPYLDLAAGAQTYSTDTVWNPALHIGPMQKPNVTSRHDLRLRRFDAAKGAFDEYVTAVTLRPELSPSNNALWGPGGTKRGANDPALLPATLTGFRVSPFPSETAHMRPIPLDALVFEDGHVRTIVDPVPVVEARFTAASTIDKDGTLTISVRGAHQADFHEAEAVLDALADPWISERRAGLVRALRASGFAVRAPEEIDVAAMSRQTALQDWPWVAILGDGDLGARLS